VEEHHTEKSPISRPDEKKNEKIDELARKK
jgi:hypothetical protein